MIRKMLTIMVLWIGLSSYGLSDPMIKFITIGNFTNAEIEQLNAQLYRHGLDDIFGVCVCDDVDKLYKLNQALMSKSGRIRADKLLSSTKTPDSSTIIIYLTHKDICTPYKGHPEWGVLGLSFRGARKCVVSDYRLKNKKRDLWKVVLHEFGHAFLKLPHCKKNHQNCIMQDARGKANFRYKNEICRDCLPRL